MVINCTAYRADRGDRFRREMAFTLVEMMVASAIFVMVVMGFISAHMFGLTYDELVCSKLGASEQARASFELLTADIRASKISRIGQGSSNTFVNLSNSVSQMGNAVNLNMTTDTNAWVRYYFETNAGSGPSTGNPIGRLCRKTSAGDYDIIAENLTNVTLNSMSFHAEDGQGNWLSNYTYKPVIVTLMEFCQYQFPKTYVGPGYYYDYYRIQLKATSHCPN